MLDRRKYNAICEKIDNGCLKRLEIVTSSSKHSKGNKVIEFGKQNNLKIHSWPVTVPSHEEFDLGIVVSFGHLIPKHIINYFPYGMLNVHASLLPRWRGAAPIIHAILNGDKETGVTIMQIKPNHFDIGEVILQKSVPIEANILMPDLKNTLANEGAHLLIQCLKDLPRNLSNAKSQSNDDVTYAPKVNPSLANINWNNQTAEQIYNLHRAVYNLYALTTNWQGVSIKLFGCNICNHTDFVIKNIQKSGNDKSSIVPSPGYVTYNKSDKMLYVMCKDSSYVTFDSVRLLNKKTITAQDFNNGFMKKIDVEMRYFI
ncbi:methionyl-tRNA formyltransferase, mitochondrial-like [Ctenocephalides felis]|uniref:methionyl-tRNA formyltransferase, mitochondrial-like n=1 Tax=Ctenocephalides felis TaxID=7515 RepID=UPI000E6E2AF6|nr:methionyl-tRNA formyltransferase, mitochondrial-like [Ctenocephalides felis]